MLPYDVPGRYRAQVEAYESSLDLSDRRSVATTVEIYDLTQPDPFAACRERFAEKPDEYDSAFCFYQVTLNGISWQPAAHVFEHLIRAHPDNFWLPLAYGHMYRTRDPERAERLFRQAADGFASARVQSAD